MEDCNCAEHYCQLCWGTDHGPIYIDGVACDCVWCNTAPSAPGSYKTRSAREEERKAHAAMADGDVELAWHHYGRADAFETGKMDRRQADDELYGDDYVDGFEDAMRDIAYSMDDDGDVPDDTPSLDVAGFWFQAGF